MWYNVISLILVILYITGMESTGPSGPANFEAFREEVIGRATKMAIQPYRVDYNTKEPALRETLRSAAEVAFECMAAQRGIKKESYTASVGRMKASSLVVAIGKSVIRVFNVAEKGANPPISQS